MKFEIHYNGKYQDMIIIEGETIEELQEKAFFEGDKRGWERDKCYSIELEK